MINLSNRRDLFKVVLALGIGGSLFAGYLTVFNAITGTCALGESCPIVFGLSACVYGFVMFLAVTLCAARAVLMGEKSWSAKAILGIAALGICFAGFLSATEIAQWIASGRTYVMVLPSCVYGLIFYICVFAAGLRLMKASK